MSGLDGGGWCGRDVCRIVHAEENVQRAVLVIVDGFEDGDNDCLIEIGEDALEMGDRRALRWGWREGDHGWRWWGWLAVIGMSRLGVLAGPGPGV